MQCPVFSIQVDHVIPGEPIPTNEALAMQAMLLEALEQLGQRLPDGWRLRMYSMVGMEQIDDDGRTRFGVVIPDGFFWQNSKDGAQ